MLGGVDWDKKKITSRIIDFILNAVDCTSKTVSSKHYCCPLKPYFFLVLHNH